MTNYIHNDFASQVLVNLTQAIFYTDLAGNVIYANRSCERYNISGCQGQNMDQLPISTELLSELHTMRQTAQAEQQSVTRYLTLPRAVAPNCAVQCHLLATEKDEPAGFAYMIEGVSADQVRDQVLVTNLLENCEDLIYFKDRNSKFLCCSQSLAERVGASSPEEMIGKCDFDYFNRECSEEFYADEQEIIRTGVPMTGKTEDDNRLHGTPTWVTSSKMPLRDLNGEIIGIFGISRDITEKKQVEIELEKINKQLIHASRQAGMAEVATNVIHNVGNVLNSVNTSFSQVQELSSRANIENIHKLATMLEENTNQSDFLQNDPRGKQIPSYLKKVAAQMTTDRAAIQEELASTKRHLEHIKTIVAKQQQFATSSHIIEETNLSQLIEDAVGISSSSLLRHNINLVRDYKDDISTWVDQHQVMQILVNLIRNAKHACQDAERSDAQIIISVVEQAQNIQILITDNGIGIAQENLPKLFHHGFTTKKNGHGFGLHSGANIAKTMGGSLVATSDGLGHGATFILTLPTKQEEASTSSLFVNTLYQPADSPSLTNTYEPSET